MFRRYAVLFASLLLTFLVSTARADVFNMGGTRNPDGSWTGLAGLETVTVGNPGNAADTLYGGVSVGKVDYAYQMGKFEVTAAQYVSFLNAKAKTDTYGLFNTSMSEPSVLWGCNIQRGGSSGNYYYSVPADYANRPVNYVSWYDAIRFANWLQNGQGSGSTESGTYTITDGGPDSGAVSVPDALTRASWTATNPHWVLPNENEWHKAAYHKNNGVTGDYWDYPTRTNSAPGRDMSEATNPGNNANYYGSPFPIDSSIYHTTVVGEFQLSDSPYGTFDQGGNVYEYADSPYGMHGGSFAHNADYLLASNTQYGNPSDQDDYIGFRMARVGVPEPGTLAMLLAGIISLLGYASRRRAHRR
jgi:formylglycine-generating enzyme